jgi:hypothetical protein
MARTLQNYRDNLTETEFILTEIGQLVTPYKRKFTFTELGNTISTEFIDDAGNTVKVYLHRFKTGSTSYEAEFNVNGMSISKVKTTKTNFFKIISTVIHSINQFIDEYNPTQIYISGDDTIGKEGQKNNIWLQYAKVNVTDSDYVIGNGPDGFMLQKRNGISLERKQN